MIGARPGQFHLAMSLWLPGQLRTSWRLPGRDPLAFIDVEYLRGLVHTAQRATIDAVLLGDSPSLGTVVEAPPQGLDPAMLFANLAAGTEGIGFVATTSSTYNHPYNVARRYLALDHLTGGRGAVNVVTSLAPDAAANFGAQPAPTKEERYRRAHEFLDVVIALWDAWEDGAILGDQAAGRWGDPDRIRPIDHHGEFFDVRGPLSVPPSPQGRPVIVQAGGSEGGLSLAGAHADVVFTVAQTKEKAIAFRQEIRRRATAHGRDPDRIKISLGVVVITAPTEAAARERERALYATIPIERATANLAVQLGVEPGRLSPDVTIDPDDLPPAPTGAGSEGFQISTRALIAAGAITPRRLIYRSAGGGGHRLVVGAPEQVADHLEDWFRDGATDGFMVMGADAAVDFANFANHVVPILQRRGLFHRDYRGATLRENYGLPPVRPSSGHRSGRPVAVSG